MLKIRRSHDRIIFNMGIPIPGEDSLYIVTGPRLSGCRMPYCINDHGANTEPVLTII